MLRCRIKYTEAGEVREEDAILPIDPGSAPMKVIEAGKKYLLPKNKGRPSWDPLVVLLNVKPVDAVIAPPKDI